MKRSTAYATAAFLTATGLSLGTTAAITHLHLIPGAQAQASGSGGSTGGSVGGRTGTATPGTGQGSSTQNSGTITSGPSTTQPNTLNATQPGAGVNPYPGTSLGTQANPQAPGTQANPTLTQPRAGEVPAAPGTGVTTDGRPCNRSGTTAPNASLPSC